MVGDGLGPRSAPQPPEWAVCSELRGQTSPSSEQKNEIPRTIGAKSRGYCPGEPVHAPPLAAGRASEAFRLQKACTES